MNPSQTFFSDETGIFCRKYLKRAVKQRAKCVTCQNPQFPIGFSTVNLNDMCVGCLKKVASEQATLWLDNARFLSRIETLELIMARLRYKKQLCHQWHFTGSCNYGPDCIFAHGLHELRY